MKLVTLKNSRDAVLAIASDIRGKKIRVNDVYEKQNIVFRNLKTTDILVEGRRRFRPDCKYCLKRTGYTKLDSLAAFTDIRRNAELRTPDKLEICQMVLNGTVSVIEIENEDGTLYSFALPEGCRGSFVQFAGYDIKPVEKKENEQTIPFIFEDPNVVPVHMWAASTTYGMVTVMQLGNTPSLWNELGIKELPVENVRFEIQPVDIGTGSTLFKNVLKFIYPVLHKKVRMGEQIVNQFSLDLSLGEHHKAEEVFRWIDVTRPGEETVRYEVNGGFKYLVYED